MVMVLIPSVRIFVNSSRVIGFVAVAFRAVLMTFLSTAISMSYISLWRRFSSSCCVSICVYVVDG